MLQTMMYGIITYYSKKDLLSYCSVDKNDDHFVTRPVCELRKRFLKSEAISSLSELKNTRHIPNDNFFLPYRFDKDDFVSSSQHEDTLINQESLLRLNPNTIQLRVRQHRLFDDPVMLFNTSSRRIDEGILMIWDDAVSDNDVINISQLFNDHLILDKDDKMKGRKSGLEMKCKSGKKKNIDCTAYYEEQLVFTLIPHSISLEWRGKKNHSQQPRDPSSFVQVGFLVNSKMITGFGEHSHSKIIREREPGTRRKFPIFARAQGVKRGSDTSYANLYGFQPLFYIFLPRYRTRTLTTEVGNSINSKDGGVCLVVSENPYPQEFELYPHYENSDLTVVLWRAIGGEIKFRIFCGPNQLTALKRYQLYTGKPFKVPYHALGHQLSRYGYEGLSDVQDLHNRMRKMNLPFDIQTYDIDYMHRRMNFTLNGGSWAGLDDYIRFTKDDNDVRSVMMFDPAISVADSFFLNSTRTPAESLDLGKDNFIKTTTYHKEIRNAMESHQINNSMLQIVEDGFRQDIWVKAPTESVNISELDFWYEPTKDWLNPSLRSRVLGSFMYADTIKFRREWTSNPTLFTGERVSQYLYGKVWPLHPGIQGVHTCEDHIRSYYTPASENPSTAFETLKKSKYADVLQLCQQLSNAHDCETTEIDGIKVCTWHNSNQCDVDAQIIGGCGIADLFSDWDRQIALCNAPTVFPDWPIASEWWKKFLNEFQKTFDVAGAWIDMNEPENFAHGSLGDNTAKDTGEWLRTVSEPGAHNIYGYGAQCDTNSPMNHPPYLLSSISDRYSPLYYKTLCMDSLQTFRGYNHELSSWREVDNGRSDAYHFDVHSLYGYFQGITTKTVLDELNPSHINFVYGRSNYLGSGKYHGHWFGDNKSDYFHMADSIVSMLDYNSFGIPYVGSDIGGFFEPSTITLSFFWSIIGAFYPLSRNHNGIGEPEQDPAHFALHIPDFAIGVRDALMWRYKLNPYLYHLFNEAHYQGGLPVRSLLTQFGNHPDLSNCVSKSNINCGDIDSQFFYGDKVMFHPMALILDASNDPALGCKNSSDCLVYQTKGITNVIWHSLLPSEIKDTINRNSIIPTSSSLPISITTSSYGWVDMRDGTEYGFDGRKTLIKHSVTRLWDYRMPIYQKSESVLILMDIKSYNDHHFEQLINNGYLLRRGYYKLSIAYKPNMIKIGDIWYFDNGEIYSFSGEEKKKHSLEDSALSISYKDITEGEKKFFRFTEKKLYAIKFRIERQTSDWKGKAINGAVLYADNKVIEDCKIADDIWFFEKKENNKEIFLTSSSNFYENLQANKMLLKSQLLFEKSDSWHAVEFTIVCQKNIEVISLINQFNNGVLLIQGLFKKINYYLYNIVISFIILIIVKKKKRKKKNINTRKDRK